MRHFRGGAPFGGTATKGERLVAKQDRRDRKAERRAIREAERAERRSAGLKGAPIEAFPNV
jgi:hypothetical protein